MQSFVFHLFTTFTFEPGTCAGKQHLNLSGCCRKDAMLFGQCPELCFAMDFLPALGKSRGPSASFTQEYCWLCVAHLKIFLALMTLGGGHRTTFEGSLCAGLPPSCQKVSAFVLRVSKRSRIWGPIRKDGAEDCCNENELPCVLIRTQALLNLSKIQ